MEIERKWLVPGLPAGLSRGTSHIMLQGYMVNDGIEVRVRKRLGIDPYKAPTYKLTIKSRGNLVRRERECALTVEEYEGFVSDFVGFSNLILKEGYEYELPGGIKLEVSKVDGHWYYAEIEFASGEEASSWQVPKEWWNGKETDVTFDPTYKMQEYDKRRRERNAITQVSDMR